MLDNAIQFNEAMIEERDQGIVEIARQIGEVNEMFQDLAVLINDQGVQVGERGCAHQRSGGTGEGDGHQYPTV